MTDSKEELNDLIERVRDGDQEAAQKLLESFEPYVRRVVRARLPALLRSRFDSMDFVQSVWGNLYERIVKGDPNLEFSNRAQLAKFLAVAAKHKVTNEHRRRTLTQKYGKHRENSNEEDLARIDSQDPTPSKHVQAEEEFEKIVRGRPKLHREIVELRRKGYMIIEIAHELGIDERSVRRILGRIRSDLGL